MRQLKCVVVVAATFAAPCVAMAGSHTFNLDGSASPEAGLVRPARSQQPAGVAQVTQSPGGPPVAGYYRETAASLACIYQLTSATAGCNPNSTLNNIQYYGSGAVIVVTPVDSPNLASDLAAYSTQFQLPAPNLTVVYGNGSSASPTSCTDTGDSDYANGSDSGSKPSCQTYTADPLEIAHAMAPAAKLVVVEMASNDATGLAQALDVARQQATANGGGEVIITAEFAENASQTSVEPHLTGSNGVIFFAPSGYGAGLTYPGTSPNVVSVGATSISRAMANPANVGRFNYEGASIAGAGGFSSVFAAPAFQTGIASRLGGINMRAVPDIAATDNDNNNVWVYNSGGWYSVASEEVATAIVAGIANAAQATATNPTTTQELNFIYAQIGSSNYFDVGAVDPTDCGSYDGNYTSVATSGASVNAWDPCAGVGSPRGLYGLGSGGVTSSVKGASRAMMTGGTR